MRLKLSFHDVCNIYIQRTKNPYKYIEDFSPIWGHFNISGYIIQIEVKDKNIFEITLLEITSNIIAFDKRIVVLSTLELLHFIFINFLVKVCFLFVNLFCFSWYKIILFSLALKF